MKRIISKTAILLTLLSGAFFTGCVDNEFDVPEPNIPSVDFESNTTIAEFKALYTGVMDTITTDVIIQGVIVGNDESGNIYKSLYIQDNTGGLQIAINKTGMYNSYRLGQKVYIKCQGLYIGAYGGMVQLGYNNAGQIGQIPEIMIPDHIFLDSLPGAVPAATSLTIPTITVTNYAMLVKLDSVHFESPGEEFATATATTNRNLLDEAGNTIIVRTSNYASFRAELMPEGVGTVYAILSNYNGDNQLYIRDMSDLVGFTNSGSTTILSEPFTSGIGTFVPVSVTGAQVWTFSASYGMTMTGFASSANNANEDWLISPSINLSTYTGNYFSFDHTINKGVVANMPTEQTVWISQDYVSGDPSTGTWEQLTIPTYPAGTSWTFVNSDHVIIPATYEGKSNVHIAFKYVCTTTSSATWEVKNVKVKGVSL